MLLGVIGTLIFHALLVASLGVSFGGALSTAFKPEKDSVHLMDSSKSLILLSLTSIPRSRELNIDMRPLSNLLDNAPFLLKPPPIVNVERLALVDEPALAGNAELAQAAEIYDRQIHARIERIWQLPQTKPVAASSEPPVSNRQVVFQCQAQLEQDNRGNVKEVLLPICNGSPEWRDSLLTAIRQASPLPAPPDPRVFSSSLVLHFVVRASSTIGSPDKYE
jgi:hypothetical protein